MMQCEDCGGRGVYQALRHAWTLPGSPLLVMTLPCPTCNGSGGTSCCDGACGGPDETANEGKGDG